jgi:hypothetical protein
MRISDCLQSRLSAPRFRSAHAAPFLVAIALIFAQAPALAADPPSTDKPSLDEQLLKDLDNELLEGLDDLPKPKNPKQGGNAETAPGGEPAGEDIGHPGEDDPLARVARQMRQAERLIPAPEQTTKTTKTQQEIVRSLEDLIKQLEKQCQKSGSASGSKPGSPQTAQRESIKQPQPKPGQASKPSDNPSRESAKRRGPDEVRKADLAKLQNMIKDVWGQLPGKAREQMLQSPPEKFLPKYEMLIEKYYQRLAEEQRESP